MRTVIVSQWTSIPLPFSLTDAGCVGSKLQMNLKWRMGMKLMLCCTKLVAVSNYFYELIVLIDILWQTKDECCSLIQILDLILVHIFYLKSVMQLNLFYLAYSFCCPSVRFTFIARIWYFGHWMLCLEDSIVHEFVMLTSCDFLLGIWCQIMRWCIKILYNLDGQIQNSCP